MFLKAELLIKTSQPVTQAEKMGMLPWKPYVVYTLWRHIIGQGGAIIRPVLTQLLSSGETECDVTRLKHPRNFKRCRNATWKRAGGKVCCFKGISSISYSQKMWRLAGQIWDFSTRRQHARCPDHDDFQANLEDGAVHLPCCEER